MIRFLTYLFPIFVNYILGGSFFITSFRFSEAGSPEIVITGTLAMWAVIYSVSSLLAGRLVTPQNASRMIFWGGVSLFFISLGFVVFPNLALQYLWLALSGVGSAFYCTPFQVFMKSIEGKDATTGLVYSTGMYTASWSLGFAAGPFIFGIFHWVTGFYVNAGLSFILAAGIVLVNHLQKKSPALKKQPASGTEIDYSHFPDYAWLGWLGGGLGTMAVSVIRTLEPKLAVDLSLGKFHAACILALVSIMQMLLGLYWIKSRQWMYRPTAAALCGVSGIAGLLLFATASNPVLLYGAAFLYGIFSAYSYFTLVFFSIVHPVKSAQYLANNEAIVGVAGISGSLLGGVIASFAGLRLTFAFTAILIGGCMLHRYLVMKKAQLPAR